jgi:hypothetical protein
MPGFPASGVEILVEKGADFDRWRSNVARQQKGL